ncbi:opsin 8, group member b [Pleuronectes platessa]|uniref:opsin 8, group member b n=1 Tax=Pleuronectes platessa TaxID=8262 RepID=UPI00232A2329|nr:opsin 8, group member b [Pleuronectes platessa]
MDIYASTLSPAVDICVGCYLLVLAVLSIFGNVLVLIMAYKRSSRMKPPELLTVNLAVTDLGAAVTMYPLSVASAWSHHWIGGDASCDYYALAGFFFGVASIMNLTVLAIVRCVVSLNLHSHKERISWLKVKMLCMWCWLWALIWALFPLLGWGRYGPEPFGLSCSLAWGEMKQYGFSFVLSMFTANLLMPSVIIVFCYFGIAIKLYCIYRKSNNTNQVKNLIKLHRRLLMIAVLISVGFIACWTPYALVSMWSIIYDSSSIPPEVSLLPCMFAKSSTVYNPLIYYMFSKTFQREVKKLLWLCLHCNSYPSADTINETGIYLVSTNLKPKIGARSELREQSLTLG